MTLWAKKETRTEMTSMGVLAALLTNSVTVAVLCGGELLQALEVYM